MADRNIFKGVNSIKFHNRFKDEKYCLIYLSGIKWSSVYNCKRCGNENSGMEKTLKTEGVQSVDTMKVLQQGQCSKRLNFRF